MKKRKKIMPEALKQALKQGTPEGLLKALFGEGQSESEKEHPPKPRPQRLPPGHEEWFCVSHRNKGESLADWYAICGTREQAISFSERKMRELNALARIESFPAKRQSNVYYVAMLESDDIVPMVLYVQRMPIREHCSVFLKPITRRLAMDYLRRAYNGRAIYSNIIYVEF